MSTAKEGNKGPSITSRIARFFKDLRGETKKVVWPDKKQVINNTWIVIVMVCIAGIAVGGVDILLSTIVQLLFKGA
ncbi:MAG: preprotein translocase subunit SecE [Oscillospiraceae bacterium]